MQIFTLNITRVVWPHVTYLIDLQYFCRDNPLFYHLNLISCHYWSWQRNIYFLVSIFVRHTFPIGNGWGCLSYLSGVKISDLVPFTVSQTLVDYQRLSWYLIGCFSLNKIPEISITRTILMIWLEPLEHIDKGILIFGIFQFLCV